MNNYEIFPLTHSIYQWKMMLLTQNFLTCMFISTFIDLYKLSHHYTYLVQYIIRNSRVIFSLKCTLYYIIHKGHSILDSWKSHTLIYTILSAYSTLHALPLKPSTTQRPAEEARGRCSTFSRTIPLRGSVLWIPFIRARAFDFPFALVEQPKLIQINRYRRSWLHLDCRCSL